MKIQRVTFLGLRGLADTTLDFNDEATGAPRDRVVFTGPPASGKTRALEAIAVAVEALAPHGPASPGDPWIGAGGAAKVALVFHLDEEERAYAGTDLPTLEGEAVFRMDRIDRAADDGLVALLERYDHAHGHGKLEYFPASRSLSLELPWHALAAGDQAPLRAGKDPRKYSFVPRFLRSIEAGSPVARAFAERLAALSPTCRYEPASVGAGLPRCFTSRGGTPVTAAELSHAEADAVLFAATALAIDLQRSMVLVDRPELHQGPADLAGFLAGLGALGRDNQLLLASSSRELLGAARDALIVEIGAAAAA